MQLSKNFFAFTTLLGIIGCLLLGYQLYSKTKAQKALELLMLETLDDSRAVIEQFNKEKRSEILKHNDAYRNPVNTAALDECESSCEKYKEFIDGPIQKPDLENYHPESLDTILIDPKNEIISKISKSFIPKNVDGSTTFLETYSELQKAFWKIRGVMALNNKLRYLNLRTVGDILYCWGPDLSTARVVIQPRNLSQNPDDDFEADIFLAVADKHAMEMKVFVNDKEIQTNGVSAYFKAPRKLGERQSLEVGILANMPGLKNYPGYFMQKYSF